VYVEAWRHIHRVQTGDRVEIQGRSAAGAFAPIVDHPRVRFVAAGPPPSPRRVRAGQLLTGSEDGQWIEIDGVVRRVDVDHFGARLRIADGALRLVVQVPGLTDRTLTNPLRNARVRARGVCRAVLTSGNQVADVMLHSPDLASLTVVTAAPAAPLVRPLSRLLQFHPGVAHDWQHQVRVQGAVTHSRPGEMYLQDASGSVLVHTPGVPLLKVGDSVEAVGFAAAGDYKPVLEDAEVRFLSHGAPPTPVAASPEQIFSGRLDATLVTLDARLVDIVGGRDEQQLLMRAGPYPFTAVVTGPPPDVRVGSEVRVSGVAALAAGEGFRQTLRLWVRAPEDVVVLVRAPWWNPRRAAWAIGAMSVLILLGAVWLMTLRRRVAAQSAVIWERVKRETELQERQRMARELHDTIEQHLAGIGFCLEAADRALPAHPALAQRHLALAAEQLNSGADEVRRSVWELRTPSLDAGGLEGALDEIGQQLARCSARPIEVQTLVAGTLRPFSTVMENHLLRIGQEALTNAVRHGQASHVSIELRYEPEAFVLAVVDDGRGFDTQKAPPEGHFGLAGMRERADAIGGQLAVRSAPGRGTRVAVTVPLSPLARVAEGA
jgi:signal transduction histidine kinase